MLGAGIAFGYLASQIDSVKVPSKESLVSQVTSLTRISEMSYSDGSSIASIDTDLLRTPVESDAISDNVKKPLLRLRMKTSRAMMVLFQKLFFVQP